MSSLFFFFNVTATTEIYTLSLHDALPIYVSAQGGVASFGVAVAPADGTTVDAVISEARAALRSEEHTSELQSHVNLVCRLLLEKKNKSLTICTSAINPVWIPM